MTHNVLVIGSGGREHALVWGLKRSTNVADLYAYPGNPGIFELAKAPAHTLGNPDHPNDFAKIADFCKEANIDLVVIGPEAPLVAGLSDYLRGQNITVCGPSKAASQIEGSKAFMKECAAKYGIPSAEFASFTDATAAKNYARKHGSPIVIKTDGLAAGKGVVITQTLGEAESEIDAYFAGKFGDAGKKIVIEEFLSGEEASVFALSDGETVTLLGSAQDHKAVGEGDTGPNTGGMGTYAPAPVVTPAIEQQVMDQLIRPLIQGLKQDGIPYQGILFAGVMVTEDGPKLIEYNIRFGDPEAQVLIPRLESDLFNLLYASATGTLSEQTVSIRNRAALCVVMAANGYPGNYDKGTEIKNLHEASALPDTIIFHAGTKQDGSRILANGGRVLGVTALADSVPAAQSAAYRAVDTIHWPEGFCRRDIGWRAIERLQKAS